MVLVECYVCGYVQNIKPSTLKQNNVWYRCGGCKKWVKYPEEFRGEIDNKPRGHHQARIDYAITKSKIRTVKRKW